MEFLPVRLKKIYENQCFSRWMFCTSLSVHNIRYVFQQRPQAPVCSAFPSDATFLHSLPEVFTVRRQCETRVKMFPFAADVLISWELVSFSTVVFKLHNLFCIHAHILPSFMTKTSAAIIFSLNLIWKSWNLSRNHLERLRIIAINFTWLKLI